MLNETALLAKWKLREKEKWEYLGCKVEERIDGIVTEMNGITIEMTWDSNLFNTMKKEFSVCKNLLSAYYIVDMDQKSYYIEFILASYCFRFSINRLRDEMTVSIVWSESSDQFRGFDCNMSFAEFRFEILENLLKKLEAFKRYIFELPVYRVRLVAGSIKDETHINNLQEAYESKKNKKDE